MSSDLVFGGGEKIEKLIYEIRGKQVMLDSDLARLYGCANGTKTINLAVKRHQDRFPEDFCFQLTDEEVALLRFKTGTELDKSAFRSQVGSEEVGTDVLRSQVGTSNEGSGLRFQSETSKTRGGRRYRTYAFTEQGVAMLATILRTEVASQVSIVIMRAFVAMRHYFDESSYRLSNVESKIIDHDRSIRLLEESFRRFSEKRRFNEIYFDGQIYDAFSKIQEIFSSATRELIIIDGYADRLLLNMVKGLRVKVIVITKSRSRLTGQVIEKYNAQYKNLKVVYDDSFHDRYFILDREVVYHCGASLNRIGYKTFSITLIGDHDVCKTLIKAVKILVK